MESAIAAPSLQALLKTDFKPLEIRRKRTAVRRGRRCWRRFRLAQCPLNWQPPALRTCAKPFAQHPSTWRFGSCVFFSCGRASTKRSEPTQFLDVRVRPVPACKGRTWWGSTIRLSQGIAWDGSRAAVMRAKEMGNAPVALGAETCKPSWVWTMPPSSLLKSSLIAPSLRQRRRHFQHRPCRMYINNPEPIQAFVYRHIVEVQDNPAGVYASPIDFVPKCSMHLQPKRYVDPHVPSLQTIAAPPNAAKTSPIACMACTPET